MTPPKTPRSKARFFCMISPRRAKDKNEITPRYAKRKETAIAAPKARQPSTARYHRKAGMGKAMKISIITIMNQFLAIIRILVDAMFR